MRSRTAWCQRAVDRYENPPESLPAEVNVLRLGDVAFATTPFEYYLDFGDDPERYLDPSYIPSM